VTWRSTKRGVGDFKKSMLRGAPIRGRKKKRTQSVDGGRTSTEEPNSSEQEEERRSVPAITSPERKEGASGADLILEEG